MFKLQEMQKEDDEDDSGTLSRDEDGQRDIESHSSEEHSRSNCTETMPALNLMSGNVQNGNMNNNHNLTTNGNLIMDNSM